MGSNTTDYRYVNELYSDHAMYRESKSRSRKFSKSLLQNLYSSCM